jgi:hypothetical protein
VRGRCDGRRPTVRAKGDETATPGEVGPAVMPGCPALLLGLRYWAEKYMGYVVLVGRRLGHVP